LKPPDCAPQKNGLARRPELDLKLDRLEELFDNGDEAQQG
jgi:hypothetical protein